MHQVFISYQRSDSFFAQLLRLHLEKAGFESWIDMGELRPGDEWRESIDQAIKSSSALIVLMSPEARASEYVTYEWSFAWGAGVPVIPVVIKAGVQLHPRLEVLQFITFTNEEQPWEELLTAIEKVVRGSGFHSVPIPKDASPYVKQAIAALDSPNAAERKGAIETLSQIDETAAIEALRGALQHRLRDVRIRAAAALACAKILDKQIVTNLLEPWFVPEDVGQEMRDVCIDAREKAGPAAVPALLEICIDKNNPGWREAYWFISVNGSKNESKLCEAFLNRDNSKDLRIRAMEIVAEIRYTLAEWSLEKLLQEDDEDISQAASKAIKRIRLLEGEPER